MDFAETLEWFQGIELVNIRQWPYRELRQRFKIAGLRL
jgi:hypothetical protein